MVKRSAVVKSIMGWVRLHPYNIAQKAQVVVEHFQLSLDPSAMVTTRGSGR